MELETFPLDESRVMAPEEVWDLPDGQYDIYYGHMLVIDDSSHTMQPVVHVTRLK